MKEFAIIRDYQSDKIALPFPTLGDFSSKSFEVIPDPEWEVGSFFASNGTKTANAAHKCGVVNVSKYSQVIVPVTSAGTGAVYSGLRAAEDSGSLSTYVNQKNPSGGYCASYAILVTKGTYNYACISMNKDMNAPIIGVL